MNPTRTIDEVKKMVTNYSSDTEKSINIFNEYFNILRRILKKLQIEIPFSDGLRGVFLETRHDDKNVTLWAVHSSVSSGLWEVTYSIVDKKIVSNRHSVDPEDIVSGYNLVYCINKIIDKLEGGQAFIDKQKEDMEKLELQLEELKKQYN